MQTGNDTLSAPSRFWGCLSPYCGSHLCPQLARTSGRQVCFTRWVVLMLDVSHLCLEKGAVTEQDDMARKGHQLAGPILCAAAVVLLCCQHDVTIRQVIMLPQMSECAHDEGEQASPGRSWATVSRMRGDLCTGTQGCNAGFSGTTETRTCRTINRRGSSAVCCMRSGV